MPSFYPEGDRILPSDDSNRSLHKIASLNGAGSGGSAGGGGSGSGDVQVYMGRAPAAPDNPAIGAVDYPVGGGGLQQWDTVAQAWV